LSKGNPDISFIFAYYYIFRYTGINTPWHEKYIIGETL